MCVCTFDTKILFSELFFVAKVSKRNRRYPAKYIIYWDASIPMEYYEDEFLQFEEMMIKDGKVKKSTSSDPHAASKLLLQNFAKYQKRMKIQDQRERRKSFQSQAKPCGKGDRRKQIPSKTKVSISYLGFRFLFDCKVMVWVR